jgi:23S rRNA (guanosine2251-2'-O)-methyltransferase
MDKFIMNANKYETVRCSNPGCFHEFDVSRDKLGRNLRCPACKTIITARPLSAWKAMEEQQARIASSKGQPRAGRIPLTGVIDDVRSLLNVGAIFRTADGAGLRELVLCGITGSPEPPKPHLKKTALGAELAVPWRYYAFVSEALDALKSEGHRIVALEECPEAVPFFPWVRDVLPKIQEPIALMAGNEVGGISAEARAKCDEFVILPMHGVKQSLNVAVAFGIAVYPIAEKLRELGRTLDP